MFEKCFSVLRLSVGILILCGNTDLSSAVLCKKPNMTNQVSCDGCTSVSPAVSTQACVCPTGKTLTYKSTDGGNNATVRYKCQ
jgi:hypothetical protein